MDGNEKFVTNCGTKSMGGRDLSEGCNIEMDLEGVGFEDVDWFPRAKIRNLWRAFVKAVRNIFIPQNFINFLRS
jgi:hypothetical protein